MPELVHQQEYPRPSVTVDVAVIACADGAARVLLIRRGADPFAGKWALPGGFVNEDEPLEQAARREVQEETGAKLRGLWPVAGFGDPQRDPRGWTVSMAYYVLTPASKLRPKAADDAREVGWHPIDRPPPLAFDHRKVLRETLRRMRSDLYVLPVARPLLPGTFKPDQLAETYRALDPAAPTPAKLRRRLIDAGLLTPSQRDPTQLTWAQ
jgi:8-oxo-dGTP diphosphatase